MDNRIVKKSDNHKALVPHNAVKDELHRLQLFADWLDFSGGKWQTPDLDAYRDFLLDEYLGKRDKPLAPSSVAVHLYTIKGRYNQIIQSNETRAYLYSVEQNLFAEQKDFVDEVLTRLQNATGVHAGLVKGVRKQDVADSEHLRLTRNQATILINAPGVDMLVGVRDTAMIALMLCTGVREQELVNLDVDDLRQTLGGKLALRVKEGKGCKQRLVPYGDMSFVLAIVENWLLRAGIFEGSVFRAFWRGNKKVRPTRLSVRAVNDVLAQYPVVVDGDTRVVKPHDLRRSYAKLQYEAGMDLVAIQQNLGHESMKTTQLYIGALDVEKRMGKAFVIFDVSKLIA